MSTMTACPTCGYPVKAHFEGETTVCANCKEKLQAVASPPVNYPEWWGKAREGHSIAGVEIPTPIFAGGIGFLLGVFLGPALIASTDAGRRWLEGKARGG